MGAGYWLSKGKVLVGSIESVGYDPQSLRTKSGSLTNAQVLALRATPQALVAAPGTRKANIFVSILLELDYTAAYTESTANLAVKYTNGSGVAASQSIEATGFADAVADAFIVGSAAISPLIVPNAALVLHNTGAGEWGGGNAANILYWTIWYRIAGTRI